MKPNTTRNFRAMNLPQIQESHGFDKSVIPCFICGFPESAGKQRVALAEVIFAFNIAFCCLSAF